MREVLAIFAFAFVAATHVNGSCVFELSGTDWYTCQVVDVISRSSNDIIDLSGTHIGDKTDADVRGVTFSATSAIIEEIPSMIFDYFPILESLTVQNYLMRLNLEYCGTHMEHISLMGNAYFWHLQNGAFKGCQNLQLLVIIGSPLQLVDDDVFLDLPNLGQLIISRADALTYVGDWFRNSPNITSLQLGDNGIRNIHPNAFQNLGSLRNLILTNNNLDQIYAGTFTNIPSVPSLSFRFNGIHTIEAGSFGNMPNLETLNFSDNLVTSLDSNTFSTPMPSLVWLTFSENQINAIGRNFFDPLIDSPLSMVLFINNICVNQTVVLNEILDETLEVCFNNAD